MDDGLYIKFRSYLNHRFPEQDLTVVFFPYSEIRSAKMITERREVPSLDGRKSSAMKKQRLLAKAFVESLTQSATKPPANSARQ